MLYHFRMEVRVPHDIDPDRFERLKAEEKARAQEPQRTGGTCAHSRAVREYRRVRCGRPRRAVPDTVLAAAVSVHGHPSTPLARHPSAID
jgi:muconolactone D-isomerase